MSKGFVIWGGYGGHNLGDEAILWALSSALRKRAPEAPQAVIVREHLSEATRATYARWGIEPVAHKAVRALQVLATRRLVVGGGQMVDDSSVGWPVGWSSIFLLLNWLFGQKSLVVCIGAESLQKPLQRFLVRHVYGLARALTCRDDESTAILRGTGIPEEKVWTTRDVVFSLDRARLPQWKPADPAQPVTVALLIAYDPKRLRETTDRSAQLIDALLAAGASVHLVAHDLRPEYDLRALAELEAKYRGHPGVIVESVQSLDDVLALYSRCDAVISGRMHPLILASLVGTLPIAFGGKAKVRSLLAISGIPALRAENAAQQSEEVQRLLDDRAQSLPKIAAVLDDFRARVESGLIEAIAR